MDHEKFKYGGKMGVNAPPINLAERKQDARLWSPLDMLRSVTGEMQNTGTYQGQKITKAVVILYSEGKNRNVAVIQSGCSMLELQGLFRFAEQTVDGAIKG
jgi:hypothetical protein